ncbi:MAG: hypothetical protein LBG91_04130 [Treponema sp.]|jgi:hypothetical protein|nr:hypothetical protein [Treponema sp.]
MTQRRIFISEAEGKTVLYFDTGLDPRSFARTRLAQCFTDPGFIVSPDGSSKIWRASGVSEVNGCMCIWGAAFNSERLDLLIEEEAALQAALQAVVFWIRGKLFLGETHSVLEPGAAFIVCKDGDEPRGSVLFLPEILSGRCLLAEGEGPYRFICPDLSGLESAAFCAAAMLYKILTGTAAYPNLKNCYQDMREGVFLPPRLAAPGLDEKLCELIQTALFLPVAKKRTGESGASVLGGLLKCLIDKGGETAAVTSHIKYLSTEEK